MNEFNPEMLILARESRGLNQTQLAELVSVKQGTISKVESGALIPSPDIVEKFSEKLNYPIALFFQSDRVYGFNSTIFFHRKRQALSDKLLRKLHAHVNLIRMRVARLLRSTDISTNCRFHRIDPSEYKNSVETVAQLVRSTWLIPPGPVRNVMASIEDAGGIVCTMDFQTRQIDAISEWVQPFPPIFVVNSSSEMTGDRLRLTLAHEIGHAIMHQFPSPNMETEANAFAAEFLMPAREIKPSLYELTFAKLMDLKSYWKVSMAALVQRAADLKTISGDQKKYMFINLGRRGWRLREPEETDIAVERPELVSELIRVHLSELQYDPAQLAGKVMLLSEGEFRSQYMDQGKLRLVG
jgi:Zn-dependent peptidase ImmA (M78 family)/transcriptional regulator with XRE-family HTH domain